MNIVNLVGRLVYDPELKYINNDRALCTFCLAVSRNYRDKDGESKTKSRIYATNFHFLGHKHPENDTHKLFDNKTLFNEVINKESQNEEISEEQIPF